MADSLMGISDLKLVPSFEHREVVSRLRIALQQAECFRAAVAYWCVGIKELGPDLVRSLRGGGFLCVDIHLPTDIDRLCEMALAGANVHLYLLNPNPQPGELKARVPPHLLHAKMLLFDFVSEPADLWVGSHNWTARALTGVNVEASLTVRLGRESELYRSAADFLEAIRLRCEPFDTNAVPYYKWLQGMDLEEEIWVLELRGSRSALETTQKLTVFGKSEEDYRNLKSVDRNIVVSLLDEVSGEEFLHEAAIRDTGHLLGAGVAFGSRLYAQQDGSLRPRLKGPEVPPGSVLRSASSWATVELIDQLIGASFEIPPTERWLPPDEEAGGVHVPAELRAWFPRPTKPLVQRAVSRSVFEGHESVSGDTAPLHFSTPKLLRKKIVRAKRRGGQEFTLTKGRGRPGEER